MRASSWSHLPVALWSRLRPEPAAGPEEEEAFDRYRHGLFARMGVVGACLMLAATLGWWPTDAWLLPDEAHVNAFARLRGNAALVEVAALVSFLVVWRRPRHMVWLGPAFYALLLGVFGEALGTLGADGLGWFANAGIGVAPAALAPLRPLGRLAATVGLAAALPLGFFGLHPDNLRLAGAPGQLSFSVFACLLTLGLGEAAYRITREAFRQRRATDLARARLEALSAGLARTVEARTAELRSLTLHLDKARESERHRIARDLHDELGQQLAAMRYALARLAPRVNPAAEPLVEDLDALVEGASQTVRGFLSSLRPRILDDEGLRAAAEWLVEQVARTGDLECTLHMSPALQATRPSAESSLVVYRVLQECTTNALKHAGARRVRLELDMDADAVVAVVTDDGVGFDPEAPRQGFGLLGLEERVRATGGTFRVEAAPGRGTRVRAAVPVEIR